MKPCSRNAEAAFTLIELLAVVAILLLLLSLLAPGLMGARDRAETAVCMSNLRQIKAASDTYVGDNNGENPDPWRWVWSDNGSGNWQYTWVEWARSNAVSRGSLHPYLARSEGVYLCPTFKKTAGLNPAFGGLTPYVGYTMNEYLFTWATYTTWGGFPKIHRSQIEKPSQFGVYADESTLLVPGVSVVWINNLCLGVGAYNDTNSLCDSIAAFHNAPEGDPTKGKGNVAFADGHVALSDPALSKEMFTPSQFK